MFYTPEWLRPFYDIVIIVADTGNAIYYPEARMDGTKTYCFKEKVMGNLKFYQKVHL